VIWKPVRRLPRSIATVTPFAPEGLMDPMIGSIYQVEGLHGLLKYSTDGYEAVVWKLALRIQTLLATQWVAPETSLDPTQLRAGFGPGAARDPRLATAQQPSQT
jgi:hypothetical protein